MVLTNLNSLNLFTSLSQINLLQVVAYEMPSMQAVIIKDGKGPIENLYIGEIEKPVPGHGEVLVKVSRPRPDLPSFHSFD